MIGLKNCALVAAVCLCAGSAGASTLEVQFTGVDLTYGNGSLFDAKAANTTRSGDLREADPLVAMTFLVDGVQVGSVLTSNIETDLYIKDLKNIPAAGGIVTSGGNGNAFGVDLFTDAPWAMAWGLGLNVDKMEFYLSSAQKSIVLSGEASGVYAQDWYRLLPVKIAFDTTKPINITLSSTNLTNLQVSDGFVTAFNASGTGSITGTLVPEPASLGLLGVAALGLLARRKTR